MMAIIVPKLTDDRNLAQIYAQLMQDIESCGNIIDFEPDEIDYRSELEDMCLQLGNLEEVMSLKWAVDCDCFYISKHRQ